MYTHTHNVILCTSSKIVPDKLKFQFEPEYARTHFFSDKCCYLFKKEMNTTIYDVILKERIYLAQEYILAGEYSLKEVGKMCGFCDYSHFLKSFKKVTGILPSEYI